MTLSVTQEIIIFLVLLVCSAFFSCTETAFFSLHALQVRRLIKDHPVMGGRIHDILAAPTRLLSTILIGNTVVTVAIAAVGFAVAEYYFPTRGELISIPVVTIILIVFGEAAPKRVGLLHAERFALLNTPFLTALMILVAPLRIFLEKLTHKFEHLFRPRGKTLSAEEFETVVEMSGEEGILNADELAMIKSIIRLEDLKASNCMTPRVDIVGIDLESSPFTYAETARKSKRNFLLLYKGQVDNVEGFLDVRKFLLDPEHRLETATLPAYFIPENSPVNQLLMEFQKRHRRTAVVVDEYGGVAGLITRGDILEEITGEIYHELNKPRPLFQPAGPNRWLVDANFSLEELNRKLDLALDAEGADRLAGWIASHIGHLPQKDDVVEAQGCRVTVMQTMKLRVTLAQIEKLEAAT